MFFLRSMMVSIAMVAGLAPPPDAKLLVVGASGGTGTRVLRGLLDVGYQPAQLRLLTRNPSRDSLKPLRCVAHAPTARPDLPRRAQPPRIDLDTACSGGGLDCRTLGTRFSLSCPSRLSRRCAPSSSLSSRRPAGPPHQRRRHRALRGGPRRASFTRQCGRRLHRLLRALDCGRHEEARRGRGAPGSSPVRLAPGQRGRSGRLQLGRGGALPRRQAHRSEACSRAGAARPERGREGERESRTSRVCRRVPCLPRHDRDTRVRDTSATRPHVRDTPLGASPRSSASLACRPRTCARTSSWRSCGSRTRARPS